MSAQATLPDEFGSLSTHKPSRVWLHRVGYLTTLIVMVQIALVAATIVKNYPKSAALDRKLIARSRTHFRPLSYDEYPYEHGSPMDLALPKLAELAPNGVRMMASPSFNPWRFALTLTQSATGRPASGELVIGKSVDGPIIEVVTRRFIMPADYFESATKRLDVIRGSYAGDTHMCLGRKPIKRLRDDGDVRLDASGCIPKRRLVIAHEGQVAQGMLVVDSQRHFPEL